MKYIKLFEDYYNEDEEYYGVDIPKTKIDGSYYHGTTLTDGGFINHLEIGYSDYEAIWFSSDENIADEFSNWHYSQDEGVKLIFQVELKSDNIAELSEYVVSELTEFYGKEDIREIIPELLRDGFDGWITTGSIGSYVYDDIAIFDDDLFEIKSCKLKINGEWSEYMGVDNAEKLYNEWCGNNSD